MTTDTLTLTDFLLARIEEDEAECLALASLYPGEADGAFWYGNADDIDVRVGIGRGLAECAAKRAIVEQAERWAQTLHETPSGWSNDGATAYRMAMEWTLRQLATVYAAHRDFNPAWA